MSGRSDPHVVPAAVNLPRVIAIAAAILLLTATFSLAAGTRSATPQAKPVVPKQRVLIVPDVRRQVFVFAKGMLEDSGLGWVVKGDVHGYAANRVVSQSPKPGTRVIDTGTPKITLQLEHPASAAQLGSPEDVSPYGASLVRLTAAEAAHIKALAAKKAASAAAAKAREAARKRSPAFAVPGAPREPLNQPSLPSRAKALAKWVEKHPAPTAANNRHWLAEHSWIVTGAKFGWWGGAEALQTLVGVDLRAEQLWHVGSRNRVLAQQALREVRAESA